MSRTINTRDLLDAALQSLLEDMAASDQFTASGTPALLLAQPERVEGYIPNTIICEAGDIEVESIRNAGYDGSTLSQTDVYPAGEQKVTERYVRRLHVTLTFRCLARTLRGLLKLRGLLEAYLGDGDDAVEYVPDSSAIVISDFSEVASGTPTALKVHWRYPSKLVSWAWLQVPGEQLLNGLLTVPVWIDAVSEKEYDQLWKFTDDITLLP